MTYKLSATEEFSRIWKTSIIITVTIKTETVTNQIRTHTTEIVQDLATDQLITTTHHVQVTIVPIATHLDHLPTVDSAITTLTTTKETDPTPLTAPTSIHKTIIKIDRYSTLNVTTTITM